MRTNFETISTGAFLSACVSMGGASIGAAPVRPAVPRPVVPIFNRYASSAVSPGAQQISQMLDQIEQQWRETQALLCQPIMDGDFIFDMVDPETLALAPAIAEYDVVYSLEWDDAPYPTLEVDDVDLEIITLQMADV